MTLRPAQDDIFDTELIRAFELGLGGSKGGKAPKGGVAARSSASYLIGSKSPSKAQGSKESEYGGDAGGSIPPRDLPTCIPLLAPHTAPPPACHCGVRATRRYGRWWCARSATDDGGGCTFELWGADHDPAAGGEGGGGEGGGGEGEGGGEGGGEAEAAAQQQPLCECGLPGAWWRGRWWCPHPNSGAQGCKGCTFEWRPPPPRPEPSAVSFRSMLVEQARQGGRVVGWQGGRVVGS